MHGNVWEWCLDTYDMDYYKNAAVAPNVKETGLYTLRGGAFDVTRRSASCVSRLNLQDARDYDVGFRVAKSI